MTESDKWLTINQCEDYEQLSNAIMAIAEDGRICSNRQDKTFDAEKQVRNAYQVIEVGLFPNILTRAYGIRQQAIYIRYYQEREKIHGNINFHPSVTDGNDLEHRAGPGTGSCLDGIQAPSADTRGKNN